MLSLKLAAVIDNLAKAQSFVLTAVEPFCCSEKVQFLLDIAVEEIFVNIISYAYAPGTGEVELQVELIDEPRHILIRFIDSGLPFNPLAREDAEITPEALMQRTGGLGILMVKNSMDSMEYFFQNGRNVLTIKKFV